MLVVVALVYAQARDAKNWQWLAAADKDAAAPSGEKPPNGSRPVWQEIRIDASNDRDEEEHAIGRMQLDAVLDKAPLQNVEMPAYWRLLKWSRSQTFEELSARARRDVVFTQFVQRPERFRGQLVRLRLHVRRVLHHDELKENSAEAQQAFELWGFTDESGAHPYSIVVPEIPDWFRRGGDVEEECVFVGYFFKLMAYDATEKTRVAPLLIGRLRPLSGPLPKKPAAKATSKLEALVIAAVVGLVALAIWWGLPTRRRKTPRAQATAADDAVETWLRTPNAAHSEPPPDEPQQLGSP